MSSLGTFMPDRHRLVTVVAGLGKLVLAPGFGGGVVSWTRADEPIFRLPLPDAMQADSPRDLANYPLFPYSNRVANRRFSFDGRSYDLPDLMRGWAIHGAGWRLPWQGREEGGVVTMTLEYPGGELWPFAFQAEQIFALTEDSLEITCVITNRHDAPAPAGFGQHPFFPRSPEMRMRFATTEVWHNAPDMIPTHVTPVPPEWDHRDGLPVGQYLDNCFAGWDGRARLEYPDRGFDIEISADAVFGNLVVFVPKGQPFMAMEPVSNINDGFNHMNDGSAHGVFVLKPGETRRGRMRFTVVAR